jgi:hypothetical protein
MSDATKNPKRPLLVTLISLLVIFLGFGGFLSFFAMHGNVQKLGAVYTPLTVFNSFVFLVCGFGLWLMKKWAVYLYTISVGIVQIVLLVSGHWSALTLVLPIIVIFIGYKNVSSMS